MFLLAPFGTSSQILKLNDQKSVFWNILPIIEKIQNWTPKNQKLEARRTTHKFYVDIDPIRDLVPTDPIIMVMGGGGLN